MTDLHEGFKLTRTVMDEVVYLREEKAWHEVEVLTVNDPHLHFV